MSPNSLRNSPNLLQEFVGPGPGPLGPGPWAWALGPGPLGPGQWARANVHKNAYVSPKNT